MSSDALGRRWTVTALAADADVPAKFIEGLRNGRVTGVERPEFLAALARSLATPIEAFTIETAERFRVSGQRPTPYRRRTGARPRMLTEAQVVAQLSHAVDNAFAAGARQRLREFVIETSGRLDALDAVDEAKSA